MSSVVDSRAFFASVQEYFLDRTGRGLTLSSRDIELVLVWQRAGVTVADVCRSIDDAVQRLQKAPRDLYALRRFVEARIEDSASHAPVFAEPQPAPAATTATTVWDTALDKLHRAGAATTRPEVALCLEAASTRVRDARAEDVEPWSALAEVDDFIVDDLFARLTEDERRLIDLEVEAHHGAMLSMLDPHTHAATMLEGRRQALNERWDLPSLL